MHENPDQLPKTLIISNNCLSLANANGRTMLNFFRHWEPGKLAQFYLSGTPEQGVSCRFFRVSDADALCALPLMRFLLRRKGGSDPGDAAAPTIAAPRSLRNLVFRNWIWRTGCWKRLGLREFLNETAPEVVLLQAGDAPFMYRIAVEISRKRHVPLVIYNSEGYVLKKVLYAKASARDPWHFLYRRSLLRAFKAAMAQAAFCVYNTEYLEQCYREAWPKGPESCALYTVSNLQPMPPSAPEPFTLLYCGNLGVGRAEVLDEIAGVLDQIQPPVRLDVCGEFPNRELEAQVTAHPSVCWYGRVSYEEVQAKMAACTMLLHCEKDDRLRNLIHAFSTKIADSLASGKPFLVYASPEYPFVQYLKGNACAHLASNPSELRHCLAACRDPAYLNQYRGAALRLAAQNHSEEKNAARMAGLLREISKRSN